MKSAIVISYAVQIFTGVIGVLVMPVYLRYMNAEAFGLIGFFTMIQTWLLLFDLGLTPTLARQMACHKAGTLSIQALAGWLRTFEWLFGALALVTMLAGTFASSWLAAKWLRLDYLQTDVVARCIVMMGVICGLRWITGLYRSGLIGIEQQTLTNSIMAIVATLKFVGVLPFLIYISPGPMTFFSYQVIVALAEALIYWRFLHGHLGPMKIREKPTLQALKEVLPFTVNVAVGSALWIFVMNLDKLLLSHFLPLREYGYFSVAIAVSGGIIQLVSPISQIIQPRMTILYSQIKVLEANILFREASQFVSGLMAAVSINVAVFSASLLFAWTGNHEISMRAAPILFWYALGNGVVGVLTLPYIVQHATGNLRLHVIGNIVFGCIFIPSIAYAAWAFGARGTGFVWFVSNSMFLILWIPLVFRRYLKGMFLEWIFKDVICLWAGAAIPVIFFSCIGVDYESKPVILMQLFFVGCLSLIFAWSAGDKTRIQLIKLVRSCGI